jgi:hypothetical protein
VIVTQTRPQSGILLYCGNAVSGVLGQPAEQLVVGSSFDKGAGRQHAAHHDVGPGPVGGARGKQTGLQVFKTGAGNVECTTVSGAGEIKVLKATTHKETLTFSGCTGFGGGVTVTPAHFEFDANGSAKLEKKVIMTPEGLGCEVLIDPQTIEGIAYANESGKITAEATVSKIVSKGTGGICGAENTAGSYTGNISAELESGTVEWK